MRHSHLEVWPPLQLKNKMLGDCCGLKCAPPCVEVLIANVMVFGMVPLGGNQV